EKRDWPVSRQLWWGHRIPVWSAPMNPHDSGELVANESDESYLKRKKAELRAWDEQLKKWESEGRLAFSRRESSDVISTVKEDRPYWFFCIRDEHDVEIATALEQRGYSQEPDVLDTWFSSALWPHSTLGWPEKTCELAYWYPTSVLITNRDIITLWVARM